MNTRRKHAAKILNGSIIADQIKAEVASEVARLALQGVRPGLAVVLVGHDPASEIYVRGKMRACEQLGIFSLMITPPDSVNTSDLVAIVGELNAREDIDGILVQLPLPRQVESGAVLLEVSPDKDVDGFHPINVGRLSTQRPGLFPCTPSGIIEMLQRNEITIPGKHAVVLGRSDIVGKPTAMLLLNRNATVTICHSKTVNLPEITRQADILVAAVGRAGFVVKDMVRPGATIIDVGVNRISDKKEFERFFSGDARRTRQFQEKGSTVMGDVHPEVEKLAGAFSPVPGGVGPLTIAMLMSNTVQAAKMRRGIAEKP